MFMLLCLPDMVAADDAPIKGSGAGAVIAVVVIFGLIYCCCKLGGQVDGEARRHAQAEGDQERRQGAQQAAQSQRGYEEERRRVEEYNGYIAANPKYTSTTT